jgi:hypothetical protein
MRTISVFIMTVLLLFACQRGNSDPTEVLFNDRSKQLIFFSDEQNLHKEGNYYDALLELKKIYPDEVSNMKLISLKESERYSTFNITSYPTLIVIVEDEIVEQIDGELNVDEIVQPINHALK